MVFTPRGGGQVLRVPYAGFVGDYRSIQVLAPTPYGFPWLAGSYLGKYYGPVTGPADWYYTMVGEDVPFFLVHFDHPSRLFRLDIYDATSGKLLGEAFEDEYLSRNATSTGFFAISWDGTVIKGKKSVALPNGTYQAKISVLKALGNAFNPAHWETWTSPVILIQRGPGRSFPDRPSSRGAGRSIGRRPSLSGAGARVRSQEVRPTDDPTGRARWTASSTSAWRGSQARSASGASHRAWHSPFAHGSRSRHIRGRSAWSSAQPDGAQYTHAELSAPVKTRPEARSATVAGRGQRIPPMPVSSQSPLASRAASAPAGSGVERKRSGSSSPGRVRQHSPQAAQRSGRSFVMARGPARGPG